MTPAPTRSARNIAAAARTILFDFDGPICNFFSGLPNPYAADRLRDVLQQHTHVQLSDHLRTTSDSFEVLRATPQIAPALTDLIENELTQVERRAAAVAAPTPGALDTLASLRAAHKSVAIVSNTAQSAIFIYLDAHDLRPYLDGVFGRVAPDPGLLKPSPYLVTEALARLHADPSAAVLIGDQPTDIEAARRAGIASIGYANKPGKEDRLRHAGATAIVMHIGEIATPPPAVQPAANRYPPSHTTQRAGRDRSI